MALDAVLAVGRKHIMPKRHDDLFPQIANFEALRRAAYRAMRGKRKTRGGAAFLFDLERNLLRLERSLQTGSYQTGKYVEIELSRPKRRLVSAAPMRDRVAQHALIDVVQPIFEQGFIGNTFANRKNKGTHKAIKTYERYRNRYAYVLRCDIFRYFPAIDHELLKAEFRRRIRCEQTLWLMDTIIDGSNRQEPVNLHFPGDDLFSPFDRARGLPIGNLMSQFSANLFLDRFDHFCSEVLPAPYLRYVDDFALFSDNRSELESWRLQIERNLQARRLKLHLRKTQIRPTTDPLRISWHGSLPIWQTRPAGAQHQGLQGTLEGDACSLQGGSLTSR